MGRPLQLAGFLILAIVATRASAHLTFAILCLPTSWEACALEGKMSLLAWQAQAGLSLYPDWRGYPHMANFYTPAYFLLVGWIGRLAGVGLEDLTRIGPVVSLAGGLLLLAAAGSEGPGEAPTPR